MLIEISSHNDSLELNFRSPSAWLEVAGNGSCMPERSMPECATAGGRSCAAGSDVCATVHPRGLPAFPTEELHQSIWIIVMLSACMRPQQKSLSAASEHLDQCYAVSLHTSPIEELQCCIRA